MSYLEEGFLAPVLGVACVGLLVDEEPNSEGLVVVDPVTGAGLAVGVLEDDDDEDEPNSEG